MRSRESEGVNRPVSEVDEADAAAQQACASAQDDRAQDGKHALLEQERSLRGLEAGERVNYLAQAYAGELIASTSAGIQSAVMLYFLQRYAPNTPVVWVDTGYHFGETYRYVEQLKQRFNKLEFVEMVPSMTAARQEAMFGKRWEMGVEELKQYNLINKVEPMNRALVERGSRLWFSGLRADQSDERSRRPMLEQQNQVVKAYPLLDWSDEDVDNFMHIHELPRHPLEQLGYLSVGDWHSSRPARAGEGAAETRFRGLKRECGLHEVSNVADFQI